MPASVEVVLGGAPAGALELTAFEAAEDLADAVRAALVRQDSIHIRFALAPRPRTGAGEPALTLPDAFQALLAAVENLERGHVCCHVGSEVTRSRLAGLLRASNQEVLRYAGHGWDVLVRCADITAVRADAVVNASNTRLKLGGGISGALARACGPGLQAEMDRVGGMALDALVATSPHALTTTSRILHVPTVSGDPAVVRRAVDNILGYCRQHQLRSVAIPALGTGTGGLDVETFAELSAAAILAAQAPERGCRVVFVLHDDRAFLALQGVFARTVGFRAVE